MTAPGKKDSKFWAGRSPLCGGSTRTPSGTRSPPPPRNVPATRNARGATRTPGPEPRAEPPGRAARALPPPKLGGPRQDQAPLLLLGPAPLRHGGPGAGSPLPTRPLPAPGRCLLPLPAPGRPRHKRGTAPPRPHTAPAERRWPRWHRTTPQGPACRARGRPEAHPRTIRTPSARARRLPELLARGFPRPGLAHAPDGARGVLGLGNSHPEAHPGRAPSRPPRPRP